MRKPRRHHPSPEKTKNDWKNSGYEKLRKTAQSYKRCCGPFAAKYWTSGALTSSWERRRPACTPLEDSCPRFEDQQASRLRSHHPRCVSPNKRCSTVV